MYVDENGHREACMVSIEKLAKALKVSASELMIA